jgi:hypothetical protein
MNPENASTDASRFQLLAAILPLGELEELVVEQLRERANWYVHVARGSLSGKQAAFSALITEAYSLSRMLEADPDWCQRFGGDLFEAEEADSHRDLAQIFKVVLIAAFAWQTQRWRKHAIKLGESLTRIPGTELAAEDVVRGLERAIAYEKLS